MDLPVFLYIQSEFLVGAISTRRFPCEYHLRAETWVLPLMVHLEMFYVKGTPVLCKRPKNSLTPVTSFSSKQPNSPPPPDPPPLRVTLQASHHRTIRDMRPRGDDPNIPSLSSLGGGLLSPCQMPLTRLND